MSNFTKTEAGQKYALNIQALQHLAQPAAIGPVMAFLASGEARWIPGVTVRVGGSETVRRTRGKGRTQVIPQRSYS
jgi:3-oxoacyl-[acyl-carrier protein] reductase